MTALKANNKLEDIHGKIQIIHIIELLRQQLEELAKTKKSLTDPEVLAASQALDEILNEYYRIDKGTGTSKRGLISVAAK